MEERRKRCKQVVTTAGMLGLMALALLGCSSAQAKAPSASAVAAELSGQTKSPANSSGATNGSGSLTQSSEGGSVTIQVTWEKSKQASGSLVFSVGMDTHSVNLDNIDLSKTAVLRNDAGVEVKPQKWEAPEGGHHRSGVLTFPSRDGSGKLLVGGGAKSIELVIRDAAGVKERVLRWEVS